jgi:hypothetical protein
MVHALEEARRVLVTSGKLLDLRPLASKPAIEVATPGGAVQVGVVDDSADVPDDTAVHRAMRQVVDRGWLVAHQEFQYHTEHYWDTVTELAAFIDTRRHKLDVHPSYAEIEKSYQGLSTGSGSSVRLRCRWQSVLAVYRKVN